MSKIDKSDFSNPNKVKNCFKLYKMLQIQYNSSKLNNKEIDKLIGYTRYCDIFHDLSEKREEQNVTIIDINNGIGKIFKDLNTNFFLKFYL